MTEPVIPDLISPIVGYRAWRYRPSPSGCLAALTGQFILWPHKQKSVAYCSVPWIEIDGIGYEVVQHPSPEVNCSCGLYAAKDFDQLLEMRYMDDTMDRVWGEVNLWGKVIEHGRGYRAEFAYPKRLIVPYKGFPFRLIEIESRVEKFAEYEVPLYFKYKLDEFLLWDPKTGIHNVDLLIEMKQKSYVKPKIPDLKPGVQVWIRKEKRFALFSRMYSGFADLYCLNDKIFRVSLEDLSWDESNRRWSVFSSQYFRHRSLCGRFYLAQIIVIAIVDLTMESSGFLKLT